MPGQQSEHTHTVRVARSEPQEQGGEATAMDTLERYVRALRREAVDRVPIGAMISLPYWSRALGVGSHLARHIAAHPMQWVEFQEQIGFDPIIFAQWFREPYITAWPDAFFAWPPGATGDWQVRNQIVERSQGGALVRRSIRTPLGEMTSLLKRERFQKWVMQHPLQDESDLEHLWYRPDPAQVDTTALERVISTVGSRALVMLIVPGAFDEASHWRGMQSLIMDIFDRPRWVHRLMELCSDHTVRLVQRLASTGLHSLMIAESSVGVGISPKMFREFVLPYDRRIADTCRQAGILTSLHICGRSSALLESMADTGADAIEPLVPVACAGDTDLADAKRRVGHRVSLMGGFNPRVLTEGTVDDVRVETSKCLEAAASGGGYILRTAEQIFEAKPENLRAFVEAGRELGRYGSPLL